MYLLYLSFTAELFDEIVKDFASNPENLQKVEEAVVLSKKPGERYCCAT